MPKNIRLYELALLHKSSQFKDKEGRVLCNERLEYLGDSILGTIVSDILYNKFRHKPEGFLTTVRSRIVQRESLNKIAIDLGLDKLMLLPPNTNKKNNIFGNAFEAFVGAVYLDLGYKKCFQFIEEKIINTLIDIDELIKEENNFKSKLLEWGQRQKTDIIFNLICESKDIEKKPLFQTQVLINNHIGGYGMGLSKRESQQLAAKLALEKIKKEPGFWKLEINIPTLEIAKDLQIEYLQQLN
jgi:ribonuclease-3